MKGKMPAKKMPIKDKDMGMMGSGKHMMPEQYEAVHGKEVKKKAKK